MALSLNFSKWYGKTVEPLIIDFTLLEDQILLLGRIERRARDWDNVHPKIRNAFCDLVMWGKGNVVACLCKYNQPERYDWLDMTSITSFQLIRYNNKNNKCIFEHEVWGQDNFNKYIQVFAPLQKKENLEG